MDINGQFLREIWQFGEGTPKWSGCRHPDSRRPVNGAGNFSSINGLFNTGFSGCTPSEINEVSDELPEVLNHINTIIINALANRNNHNQTLPNCIVCLEGPHKFEDCPRFNGFSPGALRSKWG